MPDNNSSFSKDSTVHIASQKNKSISKADALHENTQKPNHSKTVEQKNRIRN